MTEANVSAGCAANARRTRALRRRENMKTLTITMIITTIATTVSLYLG